MAEPVVLDDDSRIAVCADVESRVLDGEAVILALESGSYFGLDEVGTFIWEQIASEATVAEIVRELVAAFDVDGETARRDLEELIATLVARGLVAVR